MFWGLCSLALVNGAEAPLLTVLNPVDRGTVVSPDGKWQLTVWGEKDETPWLMLESKDAESKYRVQVWPISRNVRVLWAPDSQAFAFTDARFEDSYFLFVDHLRGYLGSEVTDLSSTLESHFSRFVGKRYEILRWYVKPLVWVQKGVLLVGVDCDTAEKIAPPPKYQPVQQWFRGYLVDVEERKVIRDLDDKETKSQYGIDLQKEKW
jgi:hypothetical protein